MFAKQAGAANSSGDKDSIATRTAGAGPCSRSRGQSGQVWRALGYSLDTPLARWYTGVRAQRLVDGPDEVHWWRTGASAIKVFEKYGTTASACGGELFDWRLVKAAVAQIGGNPMNYGQIFIASVALVVTLGQAAFADEVTANGGSTSTPPSAKAPVGKDEFTRLIAKVRSGDTNVDYQELRAAYAASPGYDPEATKLQAMIGMMDDAANSGNCDGGLALSKKISDIDYVNIDSHLVAAFCYRQRKDIKRADFHHAIATGLIHSIVSSGDGTSPASAYVIVSMDEEYAMLLVMGLEVQRQALVNSNGHSYDRLESTTREGHPIVVYFDVSRPFGVLTRQFMDPKK